MSSTFTTRKQRVFLDYTARGPSKAMCEIWQKRLSDELHFVRDKTELEDGDILVTERPQIWRFVLAKQVLIVDCEHMSERVSMKLGMQHKQRPSPEPEPEPQQSPPPQKKRKVQKREYMCTLDEIKQMHADVEAELATAEKLRGEIQQHLHDFSLCAPTRKLLQRAAVHLLGWTATYNAPSAARVVCERQDAATAAAAAPVLYVTVDGVALPALPVIIID